MKKKFFAGLIVTMVMLTCACSNGQDTNATVQTKDADT